MKSVIDFVRCYIQAVSDDQIGIRAAALAYFAIFSIFPLALLIISVIGFLLDDPARQQQVFDTINSLVPEIANVVIDVAEDTAQNLVASRNVSGLIAIAEDTVQNIVASRNISGLIAIIGLLWSASGFFRGLEFSINIIFGVDTPRPIWESRGVGMIMVLIVIPLLLVAVVMITLSGFVVALPGIPAILRPFLTAGVNYAISLVLFVVMLFLIYRFIPRDWTPARPALIGAFLASAALMILSFGFNWYVQSGFSNYNFLYGSIGTVIALIFYLYLVNYIVLLGAELSAQLGNTKDCTPAPLPPAVEEYLENHL